MIKINIFRALSLMLVLTTLCLVSTAQETPGALSNIPEGQNHVRKTIKLEHGINRKIHDYIEFFDMMLPKLCVGGTIVADSITFPESNAKVIANYTTHEQGTPNVPGRLNPVGNDIEISARTG